MKIKILILLFTTIAISGTHLYAQNPAAGQAKRPYSIVIKGGHVIDPKSNTNELMDIALNQGKIAAIAKNIDTAMAMQVVNAKGMYITPGLIDVHAHVFYGPHDENYLSDGATSVLPDGYAFRCGVTTIVDAGGAGYKSFALFKKNIIDLSATRVLSLLNIVGEGMKGRKYEQNLDEMQVQQAVDTALAYKQHIVGFKLAHFSAPDWTPVERITEAGRKANMPVMIDFGGGKLSLEELLTKHLRPGDIYTHAYAELKQRDPVVDFETRKVRPFVVAAQKRGINFDVGFGGGSLDFRQAIPSIKAGFYPNTMGSDLHAESIRGAMKDQLNMMSIFLAMGMDIPSIVKASSWGSAQAIKREELGNLSVGGIADIAILNMRKGKFGFRDIVGNRLEGTQKFECEMTIKGGRIVYDLNAIASTARN